MNGNKECKSIQVYGLSWAVQFPVFVPSSSKVFSFGVNNKDEEGLIVWKRCKSECDRFSPPKKRGNEGR